MKYSTITAIAVTLPALANAYSSSYLPTFQFTNSSTTAYTDVTSSIDVTSDTTTTVDITTTTTDLDTVYSSTSYQTITRDHRSTSSYGNDTEDPTTYLTISETGDPETATDDVEATSLHFGTTTSVYTDCNYKGVCTTITTASLVASYSSTISGTPTEVTTFRSLPSSSPAVTLASSTAPAVTTSSSASSSSSSSVSSSTATPFLVGVDNGGEPLWYVHVPAAVGPWNNVEVSASLQNANFKYDCSAFTYQVDNKDASSNDYSVSCSETSFDIQYLSSISQGELKIGIFASKNSDSEESFTNTVVVGVSSGSGLRKRSVQSWTLTDTITLTSSDVSSSSSSSDSSDSSSAATTTSSTSIAYGVTTTVFYIPGASTSTDSAISVDESSSTLTSAESAVTTSTATVSDESTILITVTHCESGSCTKEASSALVTVVTTTVYGTATTYTTYCPLSGEPTTTSTDILFVTTTLPGATEATVLPVNDVTTVAVIGSTTISDLIVSSSSALVSSSSAAPASANSTVPSVFEGAAVKTSRNIITGAIGLLVVLLMMI